jgi:hypothetical protein
LLISVYKFACVSELFSYKDEKKLTNTSKLIHRNEQNTIKISYLGVEEFHTLHALSLHIFYLWYRIFTISRSLPIETNIWKGHKNKEEVSKNEGGVSKMCVSPREK